VDPVRIMEVIIRNVLRSYASTANEKCAICGPNGVRN